MYEFSAHSSRTLGATDRLAATVVGTHAWTGDVLAANAWSVGGSTARVHDAACADLAHRGAVGDAECSKTIPDWRDRS